MGIEKAIKKIAKDIGVVKDEFSVGDVIKWTSKATDGREFDYAAIKAGDGNWWITGTGYWYGRNKFSYNEFVSDVLARNDVISISVATEWDEIK